MCIRDRYRAQEFVVNYGSQGARGDPAQQKTAFLCQFPHLHNQRNLLFLGRMHEKKGADLLLRAWAQVRQLHPDATSSVHLVMAGPVDNPCGKDLQVLAHRLGLDDSVTWTGMLQGELKWGAFRAAESFILPSHQENFGIAVAEALSCGVPVLISDQVNIWREIAQYQAGFVQPDTLDGTVLLLLKWLQTSASDWEHMRSQARECFERHFHIEGTVASVVDATERFTSVFERPEPVTR